MTKGESRNTFLRHIGEATRQGQILSPHVSADWSDRHDFLVDSALHMIAAAVGIPAVWTIAPDEGQADIYGRTCPLPGDFISPGEASRACSGSCMPFDDYTLTPDSIRLPAGVDGPIVIRYFRLPAALPADADDDTPIDLPDRAAHLLPLRCAAMALQAEDPARSAYLMDLYLHEAAQVGGYGFFSEAAMQARYRMEV